MANWIQRFLNAIATHKANASAHHAKTVAGDLNLADLAEKAHGSLTGVTANQHHTPPGDGDLAPKAHKDSHDPQDGSDPLDAAAPVKVAAANAEGSSHSFARADHVHEREHAKTGNYEVYANTEEVTSDPAADAAHLGRIIRVRASAGAKTYLKCCVQNDADGYEWLQIGIST
ncbi:unnamed protein product [marine sediment metagenome]|uniref:Uncharacterized protein n=1 Tax=marine sediment metagenome TaxID=412755 RepID=X1T6C6_9ZZZZ